ncbi:uncharacterized protein [Argopecten irradians]|uniref:uncharacterized protein n=1 Tax=Argopecten irradians TaxID=31199 RepID=UPI0037101CEF
MSFFSIYILLVTAFTFHVTDGGQICGICSHIPDPSNCDKVGECGDHEECVVQRYLSSAGFQYYDVGCYSSVSCQTLKGKREDLLAHSPSLRSSDIHLCSSCCNDTKLCNVINGHCNSQALDLTGRIICYSCDYMTSPGQCDKVTSCSSDEQCYIEERKNGLSGTLLWTSRCGNGPSTCQSPNISLPTVGKKRSSATCSECCSYNLCNNQCPIPPPPTTPIPTTTAAPLTKPIIVFVTNVHGIQTGSYVHITCRANGNPTPSIAWTFQTTSNTLPTNIYSGNNGADLFIDSVTEQNYGHYRCTARNSQGEAIETVNIREH